MNKNLKASLIVIATVAVVVVGLIALTRPVIPVSADFSQGMSSTPASGSTVSAEVLVREDSRRLSTAPDGRVTFVEFLDFECESCRAAYPAVEQLRAEYADRVSFVVRYFPIPSHANAENAAVAVEAAAQQDAFEQMYQRMFETQAEWGERQDSQAAVFRGFAEELGLSMSDFDRAVADPATLERVLRDRADGVTAGVSGTPTFFVNGNRLEPRNLDDLRAQLDLALAQ